MQDGVRDWVQRTTRRSDGGLRKISPPILLSLLCASAFCPLLAVGAGITGAAAVAGLGVVSSVGGGVLSGVLAGAVDRLRSRGEGSTLPRQDLENGIAQQIQDVLAAGDEHAEELRSEIAAVLEKIDVAETMLQAAIETGNERVHGDVIAAIELLGDGFSELGFMIRDVARVAAEIQKSLDEQGANVRRVMAQNYRQSAEIRLIREQLVAWETHTRPDAAVDVAGRDRATPWRNRCPYRGLQPFGQEDEEVFYGRQRLTTELAVTLERQMTRGGLVIVTGASGAGKSSLLQAGLLPMLARGVQVAGSEKWPCRTITPTKDPLTELAVALAELGNADSVIIRDGLVDHPGQAHLAVRQVVAAEAAQRNPGRPLSSTDSLRLVLIVDQFEQVFTLNPGLPGEPERKAFIAALCSMATNPGGPSGLPPALVVIAVRGDFWDRCAAYPELARELQDGQFVVGPMTESDLLLAITGPAEAAGLHVDSVLTDTIISDLHAAAGGDDGAGVLPLLSQAMLLTWENRDGDQLTTRGYELTGGVSHAVQTSADAVYDALGAEQQALAREILRSMTVASRDGRFARRPMNRADLYGGRPDADRSQIDEVLEAFAAKRLIVLNDGTTQIAHDALLSAWPKLRGWLADDQASWILYGQFADDVAVWHDHHEDPDYLYRGAQLVSIRQANARWEEDPYRYPALTSTQRDFLRASDHAVARSTRQRRAISAALAVLLIASLVGAGLAAAAARNANQQRSNAGQQHAIALKQQAIALSRQLAAASASLDVSDPVAARRLALAALSVSATSEATTAVTTELLEQVRDGHLPVEPTAATSVSGGGVTGVAFSPDGRLLATGGADVRLWDPADGKPMDVPLAVDGSGSTGVAFSPDGRLIASADTVGDVQVWNVASGRPELNLRSGSSDVGTLTHFTEAIGEDVAFSPDGRLVASGSWDGYVRIWDVSTGSPVGRPIAVDPSAGGQFSYSPGVTAVAFSPDSGLLATAGGSGYVRFWNPMTGAPAGTPLLANPDKAANTSGVVAVAFSPDGRLLATAGRSGQVRIWAAATRSLAAGPLMAIGPVKAAPAGCSTLAFSGDGTLLACADQGTLDLFDAHTGKYLGEFIESDITAGDYSVINVVAFSPRANVLATGNTNGTATLWNATAGVQNGTAVGAQLTAAENQQRDEGVLLASPGTLIAGPGSDGYAQLVGSALPARADQGAWGISGEAFSPDGRLVAVLSGRELRLLDARTGRPRLKPIVALGQLAGAVFSPGGDLVATVDNQGRGQLWSTATGTSIGQPFTVGGMNDAKQLTAGQVIAFSPDGRLLAVANPDGNVQLLSTATVSAIREFAPAEPVRAKSAATGGPSPPSPPPRPPSPPPPPAVIGVAGSLAFSASGRLLASASAGYVRLWNPLTGAPVGRPIAVDPPSQEGVSQGVAALALTPDGRYLATVDGSGQLQLWDTTTGLEVGLPLPPGSLKNEGLTFTPAAVAFSADGSVLVSVSDFGDVEAWPMWLLTDPHAALCAQVGPPTVSEWTKYAQGAPEPNMCGPQH